MAGPPGEARAREGRGHGPMGPVPKARRRPTPQQSRDQRRTGRVRKAIWLVWAELWEVWVRRWGHGLMGLVLKGLAAATLLGSVRIYDIWDELARHDS